MVTHPRPRSRNAMVNNLTSSSRNTMVNNRTFSSRNAMANSLMSSSRTTLVNNARRRSQNHGNRISAKDTRGKAARITAKALAIPVKNGAKPRNSMTAKATSKDGHQDE